MFERDADGLVTKVEHESDGFTMKLTELREAIQSVDCLDSF